MATVEAVARARSLDFGEVTGAVGDAVTVLPLVVALCVLLLVVAASLGRTALSSTDRPWLVVGVGGLAVATNVGVAFLAAAGYWQLRG